MIFQAYFICFNSARLSLGQVLEKVSLDPDSQIQSSMNFWEINVLSFSAEFQRNVAWFKDWADVLRIPVYYEQIQFYI